MRSLVALALFALAAAGCLGVDSPDGSLKCSDVAMRSCPEGFYCFVGDDTCWRYGHFPDLSFPGPPVPPPQFDLAIPDDLTPGLDAGIPDDTLPNADLLQSD